MNGMSPVNGTRDHSRWTGLLRLLYPGLGLKRWLLVGAMGIAVWSIGVAFLLRKVFDVRPPDFLPSYYEGILLLVAAVGLIALALYGLYRSIGPLVLSHDNIDSLADTIYTRRARGRGPRIVAIGGGTGLSVLLRGLKAYTDNITAIITVADDGGSSGRLRRELGVLPPGDFRNCIVAMSDSESLLAELFQYRFDQGDGLKGHSFGNLFIAAMTGVTQNFEKALLESSKVLAVHGQVVPATVANLRLSARLRDGNTVRGESDITEHGGEIEHLSIEPADAEAYAPAMEAIRDAQMVVIGPGSLVHQHPSKSEGARHHTGPEGQPRHEGLRVQRGHPIGGDDRLLGLRPLRGASAPHVPLPRGLRDSKRRRPGHWHSVLAPSRYWPTTVPWSMPL